RTALIPISIRRSQHGAQVDAGVDGRDFRSALRGASSANPPRPLPRPDDEPRAAHHSSGGDGAVEAAAVGVFEFVAEDVVAVAARQWLAFDQVAEAQVLEIERWRALDFAAVDQELACVAHLDVFAGQSGNALHYLLALLVQEGDHLPATRRA